MTPRLDRATFSLTGCARLLAILAFGAAASTASAQHYDAGDIRIMDPFATPTPPGSKIGAAYITSLSNRGAGADRLLRANSPAAARVELHSGEIGADGVMRMRELDGMPLPPKSTMLMGPGQGNHLMLMDLSKPLKVGDSFPMTLEFERAGKVQVEFSVRAPGGKAPAHGH